MKTNRLSSEYCGHAAAFHETGLPGATGRPAAEGIIDATALIAGVAETTRVLVGDKPVCVRISVPSLPVMVTTDPAILGRIVLNLAKNAVRFTQRGTITIALQVIGSTLEVVVTDTGRGFRPRRPSDPSIAADRISACEAGAEAWTGTGLAAVWDLARIIGGSLSMRSVFGRGAMFTLTLPLRSADRWGGLYAVE
ncbi:MAG: sensor histidine kinase [Nitrospirota bacterium]